MTIYVDELQNYGNKGWWSHMWSDTLDTVELHEFANSLKLKPEWFQVSHGDFVREFPHYDLRESKRKIALEKGAVEMSLRQWLKEQYFPKITHPII